MRPFWVLNIVPCLTATLWEPHGPPFLRGSCGWAETSFTAVAKGLTNEQGTQSCLTESWHLQGHSLLLYNMVTHGNLCHVGLHRHDWLHLRGHCQTLLVSASPFGSMFRLLQLRKYPKRKTVREKLSCKEGYQPQLS